MRTRNWLAAAAGVALLAGCAQIPPLAQSPSLAQSSPPAISGPEAPTTPTEPTCLQKAASLSLPQQVGQLLMVGVYGALDGNEREVITENAIGSVILMGNYETSIPQTAEITLAIAQLGEASPILIAVDQEGGQVRRLRGHGFDEMPSAAQQAKMPEGEFATAAGVWAAQLRAAGVNLVLAPVADTVPQGKKQTNEPIGRLDRGYGSDPEKVAKLVGTFVMEFRNTGVGTSLKHFPNLGEVTGNTDFSQSVTDTVTDADSPSMLPFQAGIEAGADAVMLSTAVYSKIDPGTPAAFSPKVVDILRDDLGFDRVIISDDLGVAVSMKSVSARERAKRFVEAGGDLAITVDPALASEMAAGLVEAATDDQKLATLVTESTGRVLAMKASLGLTDCRV